MGQEQVPPLKLHLLGPFALRSEEQAFDVRGDKTRALLAYLAVESSQSQRRDRLMDLLWPEIALDQSQANLRQTVYRLRKGLPQGRDRHDGTAVNMILSNRTSVSINPQADLTVDVNRFRRNLAAVRSHGHAALARCPQCRERLETAVSLYNDDFLSDLYIPDSNEFEDWSAALRAELQQEALDALDKLANLYMTKGLYSRAEPIARRQVAIDPLREGAYRQLMTLLARSGRKAEALAVYEQCRQRLSEELGVDPSAATRALHQEILTGDLEEEERAAASELDAFEIYEEIGRGSFSVIYRALQPSVGREVAIKVITPEIANKPDFARRLESEARIVANLEHPHIVPLYAFWRDEKGAHLVMRLLPISMRALLAKGPLEHDAVLRLLDQIAGALAAVHERGVVHRDLKPGNILLDDKNNAYLTDFGIAKDLAHDGGGRISEGLIGSPAYISPEQISSEPVTPRSDIYSLGIILYEMLAGELPFAGKSLPAILQHQIQDPLPYLSERFADISPAVDLVLARATAKRPEDRYPDVLSLAADFRLALVEITDSQATGSFIKGAPLYFEPPTMVDMPDQRPIFVARQEQLQDLHGRLAKVTEGQGQVVCISGGAGRGKSALLAEFARQAMADEPRLLVAMGTCNSYSAAGDPYLPFREILAVLTADVEARLRAGVVSPDHARRLWINLPSSVQAIVENGPDLIGSLLAAGPLLTRARSAAPVDAPWIANLQALAARSSAEDGQEPDPNRLFGQVTETLQALSEESPILLILDDLQWVDSASAALLFHLCRQLSGRRIMLACAYRADEIVIGRDGARHPMEKVLAEIKRYFGQAWIDLAELAEEEGLLFVNALLDEEPNRLDETFRQALYEHTGGHALFTVELLRSLQDRGDLQQDETGLWIAAEDLDWGALPPRIEGVIEERIGRLEPHLQEILNAASVEGELFTAQVMARVEDLNERRTWRALSRELQDRHHLIREQEELRLGGAYLTRYRFNHTLFQQYLYDRLGRGERRMLHGQIGEALKALLGEEWQPFASALARHFQEADQADQAVPYWLFLGDQARISYAHSEAEQLYESAVSELSHQGRQEEAAHTLMKLGLVHTAAFQPQRAQQAYARAFTLWKPALNEAESSSENGKSAVMRVALEAPSTLDPGYIDDDVSTFLAAQLFEGLVRIGEDHNVLPAAAQRWELLDNGTVYRFHLRPNLQWNDGRPVTAFDFVFAWQRNLRPETNSPSAHLLFIVKNARALAGGELDDAGQLGAKALDDLTLEVTLEHPAAYFPYLLAHTVTFPLPQEVVNLESDTWTQPGKLVCNGPFRCDADSTGNQFSLTRSAAFEDRFSGNIARLECTVFPDYDAALDAYGDDKVDAVSLLNPSPEVILRAKERFGEEVLAIPRLSMLYINFRNDQPPFDDRRVRQAFAHAVDKEKLAKEVFAGLRQPASGGFVPYGMSGHSKDIAIPFDPQRARRLLAEAGYKDGRGFPPITWVAAPGDSVIAFLREAWASCLGLQLEATALDFGSFMKRVMEDPANLMLLGWGADFPDPANILRTTFHSTAGHNTPRWVNKQFDSLTDQAESVVDNEERMALYRRADAILVTEETAVVPLTYAEGSILVKPRVQSREAPTIAMSLRTARIENRG